MKVVNKRALRDYRVLETLEVGIVLTGAEVKSAKQGAVSLAGARVVIREDGGDLSVDGAWVVGMTISPYKYAVGEEYDSIRSRKLLLKKKELIRIKSRMKERGLTIVPLACYTKGSFIKLEIALVAGKKQYEKRAEERKREVERKLEQAAAKTQKHG